MHLLFVFFTLSIISLSTGIGIEVETKYGTVSGYINTKSPHVIWKGIPYATPPLEDLRWSLPVPPKSWSGVKNTTAPSAQCPQPGVADISEDCLYLNIFSPLAATPTSNFPVYIWVHGGSFWGGSGGGVDGELISGTDIVVVTINYRLGALGFLAIPELLNSSSEHTYGFYGIQDQRAAFQWVKENIQAFGGDPNHVTIGGQSAGAISICIHVAASHSGGLFQHGIMESGTCVVNTPAQSLSQSEVVVKKLNCTGSDVLNCLKAKTMAEIVAATPGPIWPCPNEYEMDKQPIDMIREGSYNKVSLLVGTNHDEQSFEACPWYGTTNITTYPEVMNKVFGSRVGPLAAKMYPVVDFDPPVGGIVAAWSDSRFKCPTFEMLEAIAPAQNLNVFMYSFEHVPSWQTNKCMNVTHSSELGYLYPTNGIFYGTDDEKQLSKSMAEYWSSFIKTGVPRSSNSAVTWAPFTEDAQTYLVLNIPQVQTQQHFREQYCQFWNTTVPTY